MIPIFCFENNRLVDFQSHFEFSRTRTLRAPRVHSTACVSTWLGETLTVTGVIIFVCVGPEVGPELLRHRS